MHHFGGEIYVGYKDGSTYYQDAYGRENPENEHLKKAGLKKKIGRNDPCGCGSGKKFKKCKEGVTFQTKGGVSTKGVEKRTN